MCYDFGLISGPVAAFFAGSGGAAAASGSAAAGASAVVGGAVTTAGAIACVSAGGFSGVSVLVFFRGRAMRSCGAKCVPEKRQSAPTSTASPGGRLPTPPLTPIE